MANRFRDFFNALGQNRDQVPLPGVEEMLSVIEPIVSETPQTVRDALPAILTALKNPDDEIKKCAAMALYVISKRKDSAKVLFDSLPQVAEPLRERANPRVQSGIIQVLMQLQPTPPKEVVPLLLAFLARNDVSDEAKPDGVFVLVRLSPNTADVVEGVGRFLATPHDRQTRINTLNALGDPLVEDPKLIQPVINALDDTEPGVQATAIQVLERIGRRAIAMAMPSLQRLVATAADSEIKKAAEDAVGSYRPDR